LAQDILKLALDQSNEDVMKRDLSQALPVFMVFAIFLQSLSCTQENKRETGDENI